MPIIYTAEDAITAGDNFLRKYYPYLRPITARQEEKTWLVIFDIGALVMKRVEVRIESDTGSIIEFNETAES